MNGLDYFWSMNEETQIPCEKQDYNFFKILHFGSWLTCIITRTQVIQNKMF